MLKPSGHSIVSVYAVIVKHTIRGNGSRNDHQGDRASRKTAQAETVYAVEFFPINQDANGPFDVLDLAY
jgi:hypothetical protein